MNIEFVKMEPGTNPQLVNVTLRFEDDLPETGFLKSASVSVDVPRNLPFNEIVEAAKNEAVLLLKKIIEYAQTN